ncbi:MAG: DUF4153 domain-containing protein [Rhizobiaceae bacterium]
MTATTDAIEGSSKTLAFTNGTASASLVAVIIAIAAGDWLLWTSYAALSLALFLAGLAGLQTVLSWQQLDRQRMLYAGNLLMLGLAPLLEQANWLSCIIAVSGTFAASLVLRSQLWLTVLTRWPERLDAFVTASLHAISRFPLIVYAVLNRTDMTGAAGTLRSWLWPLGLASVFFLLFAVANPVWENWLEAIDIRAILAAIFSPRPLFWLTLAWFCWPFIERSAPVVQGIRWAKFGFAKLKLEKAKRTPVQPLSLNFFERCLILFNAVFAAQTLLDITYLWGGATLPDGMNYAEYAHRGAYPLVAAALLAAMFVLITMRPGGPGELSPRVKWLVLAWVTQNVMLLGSSVLRLDLYIAAYALTYWRAAAFIWMGLVASGLLLIVARFLLQRSTSWLITTNVSVLVIVLYVASFVNFPNVIAKYNLKQSSLVVMHGSSMDYIYLRHLGPHAFPAIAEFVEENPLIEANSVSRLRGVLELIRRDAERNLGTGWRSWTWRKMRMQMAMRAHSFGEVFSSPIVNPSENERSSHSSSRILLPPNRYRRKPNLPGGAIQ